MYCSLTLAQLLNHVKLTVGPFLFHILIQGPILQISSIIFITQILKMLWILRIIQGREKEESFRRFFIGQDQKSGLQYSGLDTVTWSHIFGKTGKYSPAECQKESNMLLVSYLPHISMCILCHCYVLFSKERIQLQKKKIRN